MKKQAVISAGLFAAMISLCPVKVKAQLSTNPDKFLGNITTGYQVDAGGGVDPFYKLWNQITPENETKWDAIEGGGRGSFSFGNADRSANYAKQHNFPFKYHTLIWGAQYPSWVNNLSTQEQTKAIEEYFDAVKKHYPNLEIIDVVNEAVAGHQPAPYRAALGGDGKTGYDWIIKAFEMAHERWPNAILVYNDYNTFQHQTDQYIDLVRTLRDAGAPIDAYGCQSHDLNDMSKSSFQTVMKKIQDALKIPMYITEYDINLENDNTQLQRYKDQVPVMWEADYCAGVTIWGYIYGRTWVDHSGLFKNGQERPAMKWLREYMASDKAKQAKSPFPGMKKEASVYVKPASLAVTKGEAVPITVRASLRTKTIDHVDFYVKGKFHSRMTEAPYATEYTPEATGKYELKAIVTATDSSKFERLSSFTAYNPRTTFKGEIELPGTLQAENFDVGAEGMAYHDTDSNDEGKVNYRSNGGGVDIVTGNGGYAIGYTSSGEWLEYTVNVKEAGVYSFDAAVSSGATNSSFSLALSKDDGLVTLTNSIAVPCVQSNNWDNYRTVHGRLAVPLEAGKQVIRINITGSSCNIDKIEFKHVDLDESMKIALISDPNTGTVSENTTVKVDASSATSTIKEVAVYVDNVLLKKLTSAPFEATYKPAAKGSYTVTAEATDANGKMSKIATYTLKVNNKRVAHKGVISIPGIIQAENFDRGGEGFTYHDSDSNNEGSTSYRSDSEGVDIVSGNGGYVIGYTAANEWLEYSVDVKEAGEYSYEATASSGSSNSAFTLGLVGGNGSVTSLCKVNVTNTGDWDTYKVFKGKLSRKLDLGPQLFRITINGAYVNVDKIELKCTSSGITTVATAQPAGQSYNMKGQQVDANYRGIVIRNGRKYLQGK